MRGSGRSWRSDRRRSPGHNGHSPAGTPVRGRVNRMPRALPQEPRNWGRLAAIGAGLLVLIAIGAALVLWTRPARSTTAARTPTRSHALLVALSLGAIIFVIVEGVLVYSLIKFRYRRGGPEPAQIRGNTPLEVGWTIGAALLLVILTVVTFIYLSDIENPAGVAGRRAGSPTGSSPPLDQRERAGRQEAPSPRERPAVPLALRLRPPGDSSCSATTRCTCRSGPPWC